MLALSVFWIVMIVLAGLIVVPLVIGSLLPEGYNGTAERTLPHPPQEVWDAVVDFHINPVGGSMTQTCEPIHPEPGEEDRPRWIEDFGTTRVEVDTLESDPPRRVVRAMQDLVIPMTARWELTLEPTDEGTRVVVRNEVVIKRGTWHVPLFRLMMALTRGVKKGCAHYLLRLETNLPS